MVGGGGQTELHRRNWKEACSECCCGCVALASVAGGDAREVNRPRVI
jgi:hypothetical protein